MICLSYLLIHLNGNSSYVTVMLVIEFADLRLRGEAVLNAHTHISHMCIDVKLSTLDVPENCIEDSLRFQKANGNNCEFVNFISFIQL